MNSVEELLTFVAKGNREAAAFLEAWHRYCHLIDDVVDGDAVPRDVVKVARWANELYSCPFYRDHAHMLAPIVQLITCHYEDSVDMGKSELAWERREADVIRHCGADMIRIVALMVGGYTHMQAVSRKIREQCYHEHHDEQGNPK